MCVNTRAPKIIKLTRFCSKDTKTLEQFAFLSKTKYPSKCFQQLSDKTIKPLKELGRVITPKPVILPKIYLYPQEYIHNICVHIYMYIYILSFKLSPGIMKQSLLPTNEKIRSVF